MLSVRRTLTWNVGSHVDVDLKPYMMNGGLMAVGTVMEGLNREKETIQAAAMELRKGERVAKPLLAGPEKKRLIHVHQM